MFTIGTASSAFPAEHEVEVWISYVLGDDTIGVAFILSAFHILVENDPVYRGA